MLTNQLRKADNICLEGKISPAIAVAAMRGYM